GGGGFHGGRGGVEGEPVPLDTPDPKYQDYFRILRERIQAKWTYPREAGDRGIGGALLIGFHIAKDGRPAYPEIPPTPSRRCRITSPSRFSPSTGTSSTRSSRTLWSSSSLGDLLGPPPEGARLTVLSRIR